MAVRLVRAQVSNSLNGNESGADTVTNITDLFDNQCHKNCHNKKVAKKSLQSRVVIKFSLFASHALFISSQFDDLSPSIQVSAVSMESSRSLSCELNW